MRLVGEVGVRFAGGGHAPNIAIQRHRGRGGACTGRVRRPGQGDAGGGDRVRIDLKRGTCDVLISNEELEERRRDLAAAGGYQYPKSQTPWQAIQRSLVGQLESGAILEGAEQFQRINEGGGGCGVTFMDERE